MWDNLGRRTDLKPRRLAIEITPDMENVIELFKSKYPNLKFTDTKVLKTFIKAGVMLWASQNSVDETEEEEYEDDPDQPTEDE